MRRRNFFWLILGLALFVPFLLMLLMASFSVTEFALTSLVIIVVVLSVFGRAMFSQRPAPGRASRRRRATRGDGGASPALVIGVGTLALLVVGLIATLAITGVRPAMPAEQTLQETPAATLPAAVREVNQFDNFGPLIVTAVIAAGILLAAYLFFLPRHSAAPRVEEPPVEVPGFDWREMLAPEEDAGGEGDDSDVAWWVQQLTKKDDSKR